MTGKQKRYLRSLAATMPPVVQIGKNGLENSVIDSARAALMARELIKVKLHNNSPEDKTIFQELADMLGCLLYTSPSPRDMRRSRMPSSA